jgi:hypothetical protein
MDANITRGPAVRPRGLMRTAFVDGDRIIT